MKRLLALIIVLTLLVVTGTLVSADGQTAGTVLSGTALGAGVGAAAGGKRAAAVGAGAGAAGSYLYTRRKHYH